MGKLKDLLIDESDEYYHVTHKVKSEINSNKPIEPSEAISRLGNRIARVELKMAQRASKS